MRFSYRTPLFACCSGKTRWWFLPTRECIMLDTRARAHAHTHTRTHTQAVVWAGCDAGQHESLLRLLRTKAELARISSSLLAVRRRLKARVSF